MTSKKARRDDHLFISLEAQLSAYRGSRGAPQDHLPKQISGYLNRDGPYQQITIDTNNFNRSLQDLTRSMETMKTFSEFSESREALRARRCQTLGHLDGPARDGVGRHHFLQVEMAGKVVGWTCAYCDEVWESEVHPLEVHPLENWPNYWPAPKEGRHV